MQLQVQTALITGGGTGIGRAIALALAAAGCRVVVVGRRQEPLEETASLHPGPNQILTHAADVSDRPQAEAAVAAALDQLGSLDMLVNNAGINVPKRSMAELDPDDWQRMLDVNVTAAYYTMRAALPHMREKRNGLVVNVASISGKRAALLGGVGYNASKFAMAALSTSTALEDGKHGIRVSTIFPGEVETPILDDRPVPVSAEHRARILQPEDVAAAAVLLAQLPPRAHVPELIIKPTSADYV